MWSGTLICLLFAVRAGTGGDEAGIWAGDLVGTPLSPFGIILSYDSAQLFD